MIKLTRTDPAVNMHRFYALQLGLTLFGEWLLVAEWGRIGSPGRVKEEFFPSQGAVDHSKLKIAIKWPGRNGLPISTSSAPITRHAVDPQAPRFWHATVRNRPQRSHMSV